MGLEMATGDDSRVDSTGEASAQVASEEDSSAQPGAVKQSAWFGIDETAAPIQGGVFAGIVFNRPIDQVFTYRVTGRWERMIAPGQRVRAPLGRGNKEVVGHCVWVDRQPPGDIEIGRIKEIFEVLDATPLIDHKMLELTRWLADYYACSWGQALDAAVPAGVKKQAGTRIGTFLTVPEETRARLEDEAFVATLSNKQKAVLEILCRTEEPLSVADVRRLAKCGTVPIDGLRKQGVVHTVRRRVQADFSTSAPRGRSGTVERRAEAENGGDFPDMSGHPGLAPTSEQTDALEILLPALENGGFRPFLIHGVTGSGKTEVYLNAIEAVIANGREAIVLVPEISLTPQTISRFRRRFSRVAVLHSHLSDVERHRHWQSIAKGEVQVVVGVIVIDEEHESTFKQETVPRYHARDVAVKRAQLEQIPILLGSATPSLETWRNASRGRYTYLSMPSRVGLRPMPEVQIIDLRHEKGTQNGLSESLRREMTHALGDGGQIILMLNRRGFHTFVLCPKCGQVLKCDACDVAMTYHKLRHLMICHTCDAEKSCPSICPSCRAGRLHYGGIGTERLEREIATSFPNVPARRMDSDTMRTPGSHEAVLNAFRSGEIRILLGTQMIAKGLDFPNVTLVGVVNADTSLHMPDFRAAERTFQLVAQVAGRTGRGDRPGKVLVQTYCPEHPAIVSATHHDYIGFVTAEMPEREQYGVPPFGRLVRLIARGPEEPVVLEYLERVVARLRNVADPSVRVLGPAPAPILKIRNLYRFHVQLRCPTSRPLQSLIAAIGTETAVPRGVEMAIDVDPISML
jgi:primosomal protein N' (replication factor Y)